MECCSHVRAAGFEERANGPADFPMRLDSLANEVCAGGENEVAGHPLPHEMKIIVVAPHVLARSSNQIRLKLRVVLRRARSFYATDVCLSVEDADGTLRAGEAAEQCYAQCAHENAL